MQCPSPGTTRSWLDGFCHSRTQTTVCWKFRRRSNHVRNTYKVSHRDLCRAQKDDEPPNENEEVSPTFEEADGELDDLLKKEFGVDREDQLTEVQQKYKEKILMKLEEEREAERLAKEARSVDFNRGKYFYERGQYPEAVAALTKALDNEGPFSQLGGEIQLWLALAYQATGKEQECIDLYKTLENTHPNPAIKRQAANLRFILEAPRLKLRPDERVSVPVLKPEESASRAAKKTYGRIRGPTSSKPPKPKTLEEKFMEEYTPPKLIPNKYVAVAATLLAAAVAWYSVYISKV
eukprot:jgi/Botrbrau1/18210/Bobra.53_1s0069.1